MPGPAGKGNEMQELKAKDPKFWTTADVAEFTLDAIGILKNTAAKIESADEEERKAARFADDFLKALAEELNRK